LCDHYQANEDKAKDKVVVELEGRVAKLEGFLKSAKKKVTQVITERAQLEKELQTKVKEIETLVRKFGRNLSLQIFLCFRLLKVKPLMEILVTSCPRLQKNFVLLRRPSPLLRLSAQQLNKSMIKK